MVYHSQDGRGWPAPIPPILETSEANHSGPTFEGERRSTAAMNTQALPEASEILERISQGLLVVTPNQDVILWNERFRELFDLPHDLLKPGMPLNELTAFLTERGDLAVARQDPDLRSNVEVFRRHQAFELPLANGRVLDIRREPVPGGSIVTTYTDITEGKNAEAALRASETRYRRLVDGSVQGILIIQNDRPVFANERYAAMLGYTVDEILAMASSLDMVVQHARERSQLRMERRLAGEELPGQFETELQCKDGSTIWVEAHSEIVEWDGRPAMQTTIVDITERRHIDQIKDQLLAAASHELRTPLTALGAAISFLADTDDGQNEERRALLDVGVDNVKRMERLVDSLLDFAAVVSDRAVMNIEIVDLQSVLEAFVGHRKPRRRSDDPALVIGNPVPPAKVAVDVKALYGALGHLIDNAEDFAPVGTEISLTVSEPTPGTIRISVADSGCGVPPGAGDRVFDRFWQGGPKGRRTHSGVGMGLALARQMVMRLGGTIDYRRDLDAGAEFFIDLPQQGG